MAEYYRNKDCGKKEQADKSKLRDREVHVIDVDGQVPGYPYNN